MNTHLAPYAEQRQSVPQKMPQDSAKRFLVRVCSIVFTLSLSACGNSVTFNGTLAPSGGESSVVGKTKRVSDLPDETSFEGLPEGDPATSETADKPTPSLPHRDRFTQNPPKENETADMPSTIAGAFLSCWAHIPPTSASPDPTAEGPFRNASRYGCDIRRPSGKSLAAFIPDRLWTVGSKPLGGGLPTDYAPIVGLERTTTLDWQVAFALRNIPERSWSVRVTVPAALLGTLSDLELAFDLSKALPVGGAFRQSYFWIGKGELKDLSDGPNCPKDHKIKANGRLQELNLKVSVTRPGTIRTLLPGLCGYSNDPKHIRLALKSLAGGAEQKFEIDQNIVLNPGSYVLTLSSNPNRFNPREFEDYATQGFHVVPLGQGITFGSLQMISD